MSVLCRNRDQPHRRNKKWKEHFPNSFLDWRNNITTIYQFMYMSFKYNNDIFNPKL